MSQAEERFTKIYKTQRWGVDGRGSGRGSTIENAKNTCSTLRYVLKKYSLHSLLDAPCGALEWTEPFLREMRAADSTFTYHGVDVVEDVVETNKRRVPEHYCKFSKMDLSTQTPPSGYDLILCRDAFQHLSYQDIAGVLRGFCRCGSRYLLVTSFRPSKSLFARLFKKNNRNEDTGGFFRNDLGSSPFSFNEGLLDVFDDFRPTGFATGHVLRLYDMTEMVKSLSYLAFVDKYHNRK